MTIREILELKEGRKREAYLDTEKIWHIAVGHKLEGGQTDKELEILGIEDEPEDDNWEGFTVTEEQIDALLDHDIEETNSRVLVSFTQDELDALDPSRYHALFNMAYQIGSVSGFPGFVQAVKDEDWDLASKEMRYRDGTVCKVHSRWYKQTPKRCQAMADLMLLGSGEDALDPDDTELEVPSAHIIEQQLLVINEKLDKLLER